MSRQDVAFLEDQLDEQASACWKQRKWSIVAEEKKNEEKENMEEDEEEKKEVEEKEKKEDEEEKEEKKKEEEEERRGHRQGKAGSGEQQTGPFVRHHLGSAVGWGRLCLLTLHQKSQRVKLFELDRSCAVVVQGSSASRLFCVPVKTEVKLHTF
jgi:hypothetical protein